MANTRDISLAELEILWDLSQQRSLRSLARRRGLQASHVSKILHRLEQKLGTSLVKRSPKGILLTPDGMRLIPIARAILENAEGLVSETESSKASAKPVPLLAVAAVRFICSDLLAPCLESLRSKTSPVRFMLLDMAPDQIGPSTFKSACEVALTLEKPSLAPTWHGKKVADVRWALFAGKNHPLGKTASEADVLNYPFIVPNYWTGSEFEMGDDYCPAPWNKRLRGDETSAITSAIEIARGSSRQLVFAPALVAKRFVEMGELKEITVKKWPVVSKPLYLSVRADRVSQSLYQNLAAELKAALA